MILNVIHPHTYKGNGDTLVGGPIEEFRERDQKVNSFLRQALDRNVRVIRHDQKSLRDPIKGIIYRMVLLGDENYNILVKEPVEGINTTEYGILLFDTRPKEIPEDSWKTIKAAYTSHSQFGELIGNEQNLVYIGGVLERCVANAMADFQDNNQKGRSKSIFYIPELCVSINDVELQEIMPKLEERGINPLTLEEAVRFLH